MSKTNGRSMPEGRPIQPGEVLNPHGRNQYSDLADFRGDVQRAAVALLSEQPGGGELEALGVPAAIRRLVPEGSDRGTAVVAVLYGMSLKGEAKAMQELLRPGRAREVREGARRGVGWGVRSGGYRWSGGDSVGMEARG